MSVGFHGNTCSCGIGYLFSLDTALVSRIMLLRSNNEMSHGLFPKDDISKRDSTEFHRDLDFEGLRPGTYGRMDSPLEKDSHLNPQRSDHRRWTL
jgi:hypothetical protein